MCNYCSEGIIRPLQCNLNEAVSVCSNIDCDFYLQEIPQNCLISKPIINSLVPLISNSGGKDYCVPSRFGTSSLSPVASSSSSTDREVELLFKSCELPVFHSNLQLCQSFNNSINQEFSVGHDGSGNYPSDMTHSKFLDFYGTSKVSQNEISNSYDAARKLDEEELNEMLNDGKISNNEAPETILDEALTSWLQDFDDLPHTASYVSTLQAGIVDPMPPQLESSAPVTLIPSGKSAFSEITPQKPKQIVEDNLVKSSNKELLDISKLSKDLNCNMNEANFLSPVGSGISEDSGYNEEEILRAISKSTKTMSLTPLKSSSSQKCHFTSDVSHCNLSFKLNDVTGSYSSLPSLSMSNLLLESEQDCKHYQSNCQASNIGGNTNNFKSTVPDVYNKSLYIDNITIENVKGNANSLQFSSNLLQNMTKMNNKEQLGTFPNSDNLVMHCSKEISKSPNEIFDIKTVTSGITSQSEKEIILVKNSTTRPQFEELKLTQDGISKLNLVTADTNGTSDSLSILPPGHFKNENFSMLPEANRETSKLSATCLPYKVPLNILDTSKKCEGQSVNQGECLKNIISINNDPSQFEKGVGNLTKPYKQGQIKIDPWSVPEIYLDELNIEVTLEEDQPKNKTSKSKNICKREDDHSLIEDDHNRNKIYSPKKLETENLNNMTVFKPISLRPEVINLKDFPFTTICLSKNKEPVRLSVGLLSPRKDDCVKNTLIDVRNSGKKLVNSSYFGSLLSSVVFDESFLHNCEENRGDDFDNLTSSSFLDDSDVKGKQHCVNTNEKEVNSVGGNNKGFSEESESELTIISVDANDEPYIYRPQKRKLDEELNCTDDIRKKVCQSNREAFDEEFVSTASQNGFITDCCKRNYLKDGPSSGTITSNEDNSFTQFLIRDKLSSLNEASHVVERINGLCQKHNYFDSHGQKENTSSVIKEKINSLRQRLKVIDSKITLQNTSYNYREINTQCFMMNYKFKNYGDIKESLVQFSDISKKKFSEEEESSFFNSSSKDDLHFLGSSNESQESSYFSESSILVNECTSLSDNLALPFKNKDSPLSLHNTRSYANRNKCYKCCRKPMSGSNVENSRPKVNHNCKILSSVKDELLDSKQCLKVSIPKYMNSSFQKDSFGDSYCKEFSKRKYIDKFTSLETKPICEPITPVLGHDPSETNVLEALRKLGWVVTKASPLINYQGPSNAITPTIIPPALQDQYGRTGSDIVLYTITDDKVYYPKMHSSEPESIDIKHENVKQNLNKPLLHLKLGTAKNNDNYKTVKVPEPKLKFSNAAIKDLFLGKEKRTYKRINSLPYQNKKPCSTQVEPTKNNLTTLKIGSSNIILPPMGATKQKVNILPESELDDFIELPDDNWAYEKVANDGFYHVKAPLNDHSYQTHRLSDNNMLKKNQIFKRKLPSDSCLRTPLKKEKKLARSASSRENQHLQSNLQSELKKTQSEDNQIQPEQNQTQKMAEDTLINTIKNSDQVPAFLCVTHNNETYVYHQKEL